MTRDELLERSLSEPMTRFREFSHLHFHALGTVNEILFQTHSTGAAERFRMQALDWLAEFEMTFSAFIDSSLLNQINRMAGKEAVEIPVEADELFALCDYFHWSTQGRYDASAGPLLDLWDYHSPRPALPTPQDVEEARTRVGWEKVERQPGSVRLPFAGMRLDLGGIGKEYAVDRLMRMASDAGIENIMISLGRDIRVSGTPPEGDAWRLGLEHPENPSTCWTGVELDRGALCCSGDYQRHLTIDGKRYSHIIDPRSGYPATQGCTAAWVISSSCVQAGIGSTALCMMNVQEGLEWLNATPGVDGCIWTSQGIHESEGFRNYELQENTAAC